MENQTQAPISEKKETVVQLELTGRQIFLIGLAIGIVATSAVTSFLN